MERVEIFPLAAATGLKDDQAMAVGYAAECVDNPKQCFACQDTLE